MRLRPNSLLTVDLHFVGSRFVGQLPKIGV